MESILLLFLTNFITDYMYANTIIMHLYGDLSHIEIQVAVCIFSIHCNITHLTL